MKRSLLCGALLLAAAGIVLAASPPAAGPRKATKRPVVEIRTTAGPIVAELWPDVAPKTVQNFLGYVIDGHYDGTIFHRVIPTFVIQGGGYTADLVQKPTREPVPLEAKSPNKKYTLAMARTSDPNSATSQFFINLKDNTSLDPGANGPGYAVFGKVIRGQAIVDQIGATKTAKSENPNFPTLPVTPIRIEKVVLVP